MDQRKVHSQLRDQALRITSDEDLRNGKKRLAVAWPAAPGLAWLPDPGGEREEEKREKEGYEIFLRILMRILERIGWEIEERIGFLGICSQHRG